MNSLAAFVLRDAQFPFEVHLFDFDSDIYGQRLTVTFRHKIRDEQKFDSIELLRAQIDRDCGAARAYFATA